MDSDSDFLKGLQCIDTELVMILSTARRHGSGPHRLPDRSDRGRVVTAIQVETDDQARAVLRAVDRPGRHIYVDVERKQDLHLTAIARDVVHQAMVHPTKPNDTTVDALNALLANRIGDDLSGLPLTVFGTGNLGFKFTLSLAERGAHVTLKGRDHRKVSLLARAINSILPPFSPHQVRTNTTPYNTKVLVSAVTARGAIGSDWLGQLAPSSLCVDVGIGNFTPAFIELAHQHGHTVTRLDVRCAGDPLPLCPNPFFNTVAGERTVGQITMVAGGLIGKRGTIVVDNVSNPTLLVGVADGLGGLMPAADRDIEMERHIEAVLSWIITSVPK